jgi:hypothetical protein
VIITAVWTPSGSLRKHPATATGVAVLRCARAGPRVYIAVFGDEIEVLSPQALRQTLANIGGELVATYRLVH